MRSICKGFSGRGRGFLPFPFRFYLPWCSFRSSSRASWCVTSSLLFAAKYLRMVSISSSEKPFVSSLSRCLFPAFCISFLTGLARSRCARGNKQLEFRELVELLLDKIGAFLSSLEGGISTPFPFLVSVVFHFFFECGHQNLGTLILRNLSRMYSFGCRFRKIDLFLSRGLFSSIRQII